MSPKELTRLDILKRLDEKRLTQKEAAEMLGLSIRHVKRLCQAYRKQGVKGLISQRRGKPSNNRLDPQIARQVLDLILARYYDFGPTLAHEKLVEVHQLQLSVEKVRQIMMFEGIWKPKHKRKVVTHQMRERRACEGELVQIDGSPHDWFEGRGLACTLLVFIDDATGKLQTLLFVTSESFFSYAEAVRQYIARYGKPVALYSDKHGIFHINHPQTQGKGDGMTQFGRAMKELDIEIICANTPQAKGRVERVNQTLQDRLTKELRLRGISTMADANAYLPEFMEDFNRRFAVTSRCSHNAHRPLRPSDNLDLILTRQEWRELSKNLTLQYEKVMYQIQSQRPGYALRQAKVKVSETAQGNIQILYKGQPLEYTVYHKLPRQAEIVSSKDLAQQPRLPHSPAADHPWRTYGQTLNGHIVTPYPADGMP
jgi:transposase